MSTAKVTTVVKTPAEILLGLLEEGTKVEGFKVPLEDEFKAIFIAKFVKEEFLPKLSFTIENGKKLFKLLDKSGYLDAGTPLLGLFELHESQTKYNKKVQYLTPKGDWLKTDLINTAVPSELDVVAGQ